MRAIWNFIKAVIGYARVTWFSKNDVVEWLYHKRSVECQYCHLDDREGRTLFRWWLGQPYCGKPFKLKPFRDPKLDGCGCKLDLKWQDRKQRCPHGRW